MAEPINEITTTAKRPSSSGYSPYDLLFTGTDPADIFSELTFGEGSAAPTEGTQADLIISGIMTGEIDPKTLAPEIKDLVKNKLIAQGVSEADVNAAFGDSTSTRNVGDPLSYDMENALALGAAKEAGLDAGGPFGADLGSVLQQLQTGPVQPTSTTPTTTATNEQLEQERQTLIDIIREAGGEVGAAAVEGIADLGNLVIQAVTLGKGPQLEAVVPNIMDLIKGGIGGQLVFGGGQTPATVVGTGQTGPGRGTKVAVGGIFGTIADIFKQGGNLGTVITQFPTILIDNLPGVIAAAASAGYAFSDDDKQTVVKAGLEPSILDGIDGDTTKTTPTTTIDDAAKVVGSTDPLVGGLTTEQAETIGAAEVNDTTKTTKFDGAGTKTTKILDGLKLPTDGTTTTTTTTATEPDEIKFTMGSPQFETTTVKTGPTLATTLGQDQSQVKTTPVDLMASLASDEEKIVTPAELAAILGSESTETIRTSTAPTLTAALGGGGGGGGGSFSLPTSGGMRSVSGGPGPTVDLDYLYDFYGDLTQPFQASEDEEDIVKAAEGGMIGNTDDFERILRLLRGA